MLVDTFGAHGSQVLAWCEDENAFIQLWTARVIYVGPGGCVRARIHTGVGQVASRLSQPLRHLQCTVGARVRISYGHRPADSLPL